MTQQVQKKRQYQEIWERIRDSKKNSVRLQVEPILVPRVKKAIIKEKHLDLGFKVLNDHDHFFLVFSYDREKKVLSVKLDQTLGLEGVKHG